MLFKGNKKLGLTSLVCVNPFAAFMVGLLHPRDPASKNLVWIFIIFYGAVFYVSETTGGDSIKYYAQLKWMYDSGFTLDDLLYLMYHGQGGYQDVYQPLITFLISRFTDQAWVLFGVFGILLGYVYSRNIWFLVERVGNRNSAVGIFLIVAFAMNASFAEGLNGVRFWTACHVFMYGVLFYLGSRELKYLLVALLTPLIHFSFIIPCALFLGFLLIRRYGTAIYVFFVASFLVSQLDLTIIKTAIQYLPLSFEDRSMNYLNMLDAPTRYGAGQQGPWFLRLNGQLSSVFAITVSTFLFWKRFHRRRNAGSNIFMFGMLIYGATNIVSYVPSAGRFFVVGELLLIAAVILYLGQNPERRKDAQLLGGTTTLLLISIALGVRATLEFASVYLLLGNFFIAPFVDAEVGLYEFFRG